MRHAVLELFTLKHTYDYSELGGQKYPHAVRFGIVEFGHHADSGWGLYNLNSQYSTLTFIMGHVDGTPMRDGKLSIYLDGELSFEVEMSPSDLPQTFTVPLHNALQMKIQMNNGCYRLAQMEIQ